MTGPHPLSSPLIRDASAALSAKPNSKGEGLDRPCQPAMSRPTWHCQTKATSTSGRHKAHLSRSPDCQRLLASDRGCVARLFPTLTESNQ